MFKLITAMSFHVLMNANPEAGGGGAAAAAPVVATVVDPNPAPAPSNTATEPVVSNNPLSFIPESLRNEGWVKKYTNEQDFWKGVDNTIKMVGAREVKQVQGIELPGDQATEEDLNNFYAKLGRPESPDKYQLPEDVTLPESFDVAAEKKAFTELAHKANLTPHQAKVLFKEYANVISKNVPAEPSLEQSLKEAFGDKSQEGYDQAKKGSDTLGLTDKLNSAGLGRNPLVLQLCAELGKLAGEGTIARIDSSTDSAESILAEAHRIQATPEYKNGDKALHAKVYGLFQKVYG